MEARKVNTISDIFAGSAHFPKNSPWPAPRTTISEIVETWQEPVKVRLEELIRLEEGWDGYTAFPVSFVNAMFAFRMLESICLPDTPAPQIVPGPSGDLQVEWHTRRGDIELWVRGPNRVHAWREASGTGEDEVLELTTDFSVVARWVQEFTEQTIAVPTTA
jgi:hypothetical protein